MFAVALEPEQLPHMLGLAHAFKLMDTSGLTITATMPGEMEKILEYLAEWSAPPPTDEVGARKMVAHWLAAYALMYGEEHISNLGVDTPKSFH